MVVVVLDALDARDAVLLPGRDRGRASGHVKIFAIDMAESVAEGFGIFE